MRKFGHNIFREFGVGQPIMEDKIKDEISFFINRVEDMNQKAFDPHYAVMCTVSNVVASLVYGKRFQYDDPVFIKLMDIMETSFKIVGNSGPLTVFPILRHLPGDVFKFKWLIRDIMPWIKCHDFGQIKKHRDNLHDDQASDIIDAFLLEMNKNQDKPESYFDGMLAQCH